MVLSLTNYERVTVDGVTYYKHAKTSNGVWLWVRRDRLGVPIAGAALTDTNVRGVLDRGEGYGE